MICSGTNPRQIQAISDEVELRLKRAGHYPNNIEGHKQAEWVLIDYVDFVVHIFSSIGAQVLRLGAALEIGKKNRGWGVRGEAAEAGGGKEDNAKAGVVKQFGEFCAEFSQ